MSSPGSVLFGGAPYSPLAPSPPSSVPNPTTPAAEPEVTTKAPTETRVKPPPVELDERSLLQGIGAIVRKRRVARGYSLDRLCDVSGVSRSMLSRIERGESMPTVGTLLRLGKVLTMELGEFIPTVPTPIFRHRPAVSAWRSST